MMMCSYWKGEHTKPRPSIHSIDSQILRFAFLLVYTVERIAYMRLVIVRLRLRWYAHTTDEPECCLCFISVMAVNRFSFSYPFHSCIAHKPSQYVYTRRLVALICYMVFFLACLLIISQRRFNGISIMKTILIQTSHNLIAQFTFWLNCRRSFWLWVLYYASLLMNVLRKNDHLKFVLFSPNIFHTRWRKSVSSRFSGKSFNLQFIQLLQKIS